EPLHAPAVCYSGWRLGRPVLDAAGLGSADIMAAGLDHGADLLGGKPALEHFPLELEVELGQADLPPAHVEADAHDSDHYTDERDKGDLGDGHEPGVCGEDVEHVRASRGWGTSGHSPAVTGSCADFRTGRPKRRQD